MSVSCRCDKTELARDYQLSADEHVKTWVSSWRNGGDEAWLPRPESRPKGISKPKVLTEEEKLRRAVKRLQAENTDLENYGI